MARRVEVEIVGDASKLSRSFQSAGRDGERFGKRLKGVGSGVRGLGLAGAVAGVALVGGLAAGLKSCLSAAVESEASQKRLDATLKNVGATSGDLRGKIDAANTSLSQMSGFDDEDLQDAFSNTVRLTGDAQGSLKNYGLIADLARGKNISLATASTLVGKVMNGNTSVLSKFGISLKKGATAQEALAALQKKFGGAAKAYGESTAGAMDRAKVSFGNVKEQIGSALLPAIAAGLNAFSGFATRAMPAVQASLQRGADWIRSVWPQVRAVLVGAWQTYVQYWHSVVEPVFRQVVATVGRIVAYVVAHWPQISAAIRAGLAAARAFVISTMLPLAQAIISRVRQIVSFVRAHWQQIRTVILAVGRIIVPFVRTMMQSIRAIIQAITAVINGQWSKAWQLIKQAASLAMHALIGLLRALAPLAYAAMTYVGNYAKNGLIHIVQSIPGKAKTALGALQGALSSIAKDAYGWAGDIGSQILSSILDGLTTLGDDVAKLVKDAVNGVIGLFNGLSLPKVEIGGTIPGFTVGAPFGIGPSVTLGPWHPSASAGPWPLPDLPTFAKGGIVTRPTVAIVGDNPGGREAMIPLPRGMGAAALGRGGGGDVHLHIAGSVLAERELLDLVQRGSRVRARLAGGFLAAGSVRSD